MRVLSLFDGVSTGQYVLRNLGFDLEKVFVSEINNDVIEVTQHHFPDTIQLGDVSQLDLAALKEQVGEIDLLIGGSPCQNLSIAVVNNIKHNQGLEGAKSSLFYTYLAIKEAIQPKFFMLENVASMRETDKNIITEALGVKSIMINANSFSAQNRERYFWTNIDVEPVDFKSSEVIKDILDGEVPEKYWYKEKSFEVFEAPKGNQVAHLNVNGHDILKRVYGLEGKSPTLTTVQGGYQEKKILDYHKELGWLPRKLTPNEYEKLQGFEGNYTNIKKSNGRPLSDSARYSAMGNGWSVPVIEHIFKGLVKYYE